MIAIYSHRTVLPTGTREATVLVNEGKIIDITDQVPLHDNYEFVDLGDKWLLPGLIDPHVHINEPGRTEWEGFDTAGKGAIAGGLTTLVDMPLNSSQVTTSLKAFDEKLASTKNKLYTNIGFWDGVAPGNENEVAGLIDRGVLGFKAFLTHSDIDEFPNVTEDDLRKVMPVIAKNGLPLLVHCELADSNSRFDGDECNYNNYLRPRPKK